MKATRRWPNWLSSSMCNRPGHAMAKRGAGRAGWSVRRGQGRDEGGAERRLEALHAKIGELPWRTISRRGATKAGSPSARR